MNKISKELKDAIRGKVFDALNQKDEAVTESANKKYKPRLEKITKIRKEFDAEVEILSRELKKQNFALYGTDSDNPRIEQRMDRQNAENIFSKVIVQLQYSKEPDFLESIDRIISEQIKKAPVEKIEIEI